MTHATLWRTDITPRHFRGISTVEDLRQRCLFDDLTECWLYQGAIREDRYGNRMPAIWIFDSLRKKFRTMTGPMAVLEIEGTRKPEMTTAWRTCRCGDCVNPAHIIGGTRADLGRWLRNKGLWKHNPARIAANRKSARARSGLTQEIVEQIKQSPLNGVQAAAEFGISKQQVSKVRNGKVWASTVAPGASVFTLGAR